MNCPICHQPIEEHTRPELNRCAMFKADIERRAEQRAGYRWQPKADALNEVVSARGRITAARAATARAIHEARKLGATWPEVAEALSVTVEDARRYAAYGQTARGPSR